LDESCSKILAKVHNSILTSYYITKGKMTPKDDLCQICVEIDLN